MIGTRLGTYEIREQVGSGGMATVYRAYQPNMDRFVAIKVIRAPVLADKTLRERFQREAKLIARLEHPHLLPVYDFDGSHDPPYIAMRFLEGGTLKQVLGAGRLPYNEMVYMLRQIASALDYAHRQGIVHRDLKPSNIMIDREGNAFIADFGIARISDNSEDLTGSGVLIGTPGYMAPEQARGDSGIDHRADLYSLGALVFEMLSGHQPYESPSNLEVVMAHVNKAVPNITDVQSELPRALDQILKTALAKRQDDRYKTATAFVEALSKALEVEESGVPEQLQNMTQIISRHQLEELQEATSGNGGASETPSDQQRQMSAVYLDVTELAEMLYEKGLETETVRSEMDSLWRRFHELAQSHGGLIQSRTDEVGVALWGTERSREDDAEQAIRAALEMKEATLERVRMSFGNDWVASEESPLPFVAGVTNGPVLLERDGESGTYTASGATITLAGRLKEAAPAGGILVDHDSYIQVRGVFTFQEHEPLRVRGRRDKLDVYLAIYAKARSFRMKIRGIEGIETKMIGREIELRLLQEALTLTLEDSETQVVTVVGEAGVGKSRLLAEFTSWIDLIEQKLWFFEARATQPSMLQPYSLTRDLFSFRFQILDSDPLEVVYEKFIKGIAEFTGEEDDERAELIGQLVGFDFSNYPAVAAAIENPEQFQEQALGYLGEFFLSASKTNPVFIQIEDIHWADDRSLDLINNLVRENTQIPLFVICMARPSLYERRPQWGEGQRFHARVQLEPLSLLSSRRLVKELMKLAESVPTQLRDLIIDRADGNPFYIEELIKALIDDRVIVKGDDQWTIDDSRLSSVRIPPTLTGVLQSRLDTLPSGLQQVLQRASVIGRVFWDSALAQLSTADGVTATAVTSMLADVREREMIFQREESGFEGTGEYVFRHAILRDVTYQTLVPRQRRTYHKLVGDWLVGIGGERASEHSLLVAKHYELAGENALAGEKLLEAGLDARKGGNFHEAIRCLQLAKEQLAGEELERERIAVQVELGETHSYLAEHQEALAELEPAVEIARRTGQKDILVKGLAQTGRVVGLWLGEPEKGLVCFQEALPITKELGDDTTRVLLLRMMGTMLMFDKEADAEPYLLESLELARKIRNEVAIASVLNTLAIVNSVRGNWDDAARLFGESLESFRKFGGDFGIGMVLTNTADMHLRHGEIDLAITEIEEGLKISNKLSHNGFLGNFYFLRAKYSMLKDEVEAAKSDLHRASKHCAATGEPASLLGCLLQGARWRKIMGNRVQALEWLGLIRSHHASDPIMKRDADELIKQMCPDPASEELKAALARGEGLDVSEEIKTLTKETA